MDKIDFVVPWVDSNDPAWIESYNYYRQDKTILDKVRFRNWGLFRYWFRAVEKYAPWVNKVFLITNGKFPDWINPECKKLVLVKHSDYIPDKYLPTFNSKTIELNLGRINELSEHFVYFNDDIFINSPITPQHYFKEGLPCDYNFETVFRNPIYNKYNRFGFELDNLCDISVINNHFSRMDTIRQAWKKWYGRHLWGKPIFFSLLLFGRPWFENFAFSHLENPMLKSIFQEIWEEEEEFLDRSCSRFRDDASLNQHLIRYWQFASNKFYPSKRYGLAYFTYSKEITDDLIINLKSGHCSSICINDNPFICKEDFEYATNNIRIAFEEKFPKISIFEKKT